MTRPRVKSGIARAERKGEPMRRMAGVLVLIAVVAGLIPLTAAPASARIVRRAVVTCQGCWPTAFTFTPDGDRMFFVERFSGEIRMYNFKTRTNRRWGRLGNIASGGETGLLGITLHPRWPAVKRVYVYYTNADPFGNRIARLRWERDGTPRRNVLLRIRANTNHNGGVIHFGPDGLLYAVTGDAGDPSLSQDTSSNSGKILRMTVAGRVPDTNPFPGEYAFSYGHRNSFGFAFDPRTGRLWQTENGQDCDEVNLARRGRNYGWGPPGDVAACPDNRGVNPETSWHNPDIAPTGATFCVRCQLGSATGGRLIVGAWNDGRIRRLKLDPERNDIVARRLVFDNPLGVLGVESRPGGRIFFSDQNGIYRLVRV